MEKQKEETEEMRKRCRELQEQIGTFVILSEEGNPFIHFFHQSRVEYCEVCGKRFVKGICNDCGLPSKDMFLKALKQARKK